MLLEGVALVASASLALHGLLSDISDSGKAVPNSVKHALWVYLLILYGLRLSLPSWMGSCSQAARQHAVIIHTFQWIITIVMARTLCLQHDNNSTQPAFVDLVFTTTLLVTVILSSP